MKTPSLCPLTPAFRSMPLHSACCPPPRSHLARVRPALGPCFSLGLSCMPVTATPTSPPSPLRLTKLLPGVSVGRGCGITAQARESHWADFANLPPYPVGEQFLYPWSSSPDTESPRVPQLPRVTAWEWTSLEERTSLEEQGEETCSLMGPAAMGTHQSSKCWTVRL